MDTKKDNKQQIAYDFIRRGIIDGTFSPGQRLVIDQLAKELSTSPIPVREAIHRLEAEGLVNIRPYSGAVVLSMNEDEYKEILSTLAVLDGYAASLSFPLMEESHITALREINERMKQSLEQFDFFSFVSLNREFHSLSSKCCENQYLVSQVELLWEKLDTIRRISLKYFSFRAHDVIEEHEKIIKLIEGRSPKEEVEDYIRKHHMKALPKEH
ncbi:GntR family transcriptional regulator [Brevibacillus fluminis]|nr:GntR family transcriptional regulator [Brevibacillus fluminis]